VRHAIGANTTDNVSEKQGGPVNLSARAVRRPAPRNLFVLDLAPRLESFAEEVVQGLSQTPKTLSPKFFYDQRGAQLFTAICTTRAYYPTRTENRILTEQARAIAQAIGANAVIIEYGAGEIEKVRRLLPAAHPSMYVGLDISGDQLVRASTALAMDYPWLQVVAVIGDYQSELEAELTLPARSRRVVFFPGSTVGNFEPQHAREFLRRVRKLVGDEGGIVIGVDLQKPIEVLNLAYNDPQGYTAAFNLNLLVRMNRELDADFDLSAFSHRAFYNAERARIEMHLVSARRQTVHIGAQAFHFAAGESIHTESSYKYTPESFAALAREAGFERRQMWSDPAQWFGVFFLHN
jgi:dimethylhistidine N-methyltransferase